MVDESAVRFLQSFSGPAALTLPTPFGKYVLLHPLATGGMGTVFIARSSGLQDIQKLCVIKTLRSHFAGDQDYVVRFMDEARVVVQIDHRNICHVFDVGFCDGRYFLAMELIRGADLRALWHHYADQDAAVPLGIALHIACEMLEALDYAHRLTDPVTGEPLHLVHRDVSPQNVMLSFEGEVKVIDFGLAASTLKLEQTAPQVVMGKVAYMSPEQARGEKVDRSTDLFAAGVVLYELLTGKRYYDGMSPHQIWAVVGTGEYRPPHWHLIDPRLQVLLGRALHPDRARRPATCAVLRRELLDVALDRRLRDGAPELRGVMTEAFADVIEEQRRLMASFANLKERSASVPIPAENALVVDSPGAEPTVTATEAVADTGETRTEKVAEALLVAPDTRFEGRRPTPRYASAGVGLAAVVVAAVAIAVFAAGEEDALPVKAAAAQDAPPAPVGAYDPPPTVDEPPPAPEEPPDKPDVVEPDVVEPPAVEAAAVAPPTVSEERAKPPTGRGRTKPVAAKPKPKPRVVRKPPPPKSNAPLLDHLTYLDKHCQEHRCAVRVKSRFKQIADLKHDEIPALDARARQCVRVCSGR